MGPLMDWPFGLSMLRRRVVRGFLFTDGYSGALPSAPVAWVSDRQPSLTIIHYRGLSAVADKATFPLSYARPFSMTANEPELLDKRDPSVHFDISRPVVWTTLSQAFYAAEDLSLMDGTEDASVEEGHFKRYCHKEEGRKEAFEEAKRLHDQWCLENHISLEASTGNDKKGIASPSRVGGIIGILKEERIGASSMSGSSYPLSLTSTRERFLEEWDATPSLMLQFPMTLLAKILNILSPYRLVTKEERAFVALLTSYVLDYPDAASALSPEMHSQLFALLLMSSTVLFGHSLLRHLLDPLCHPLLAKWESLPVTRYIQRVAMLHPNLYNAEAMRFVVHRLYCHRGTLLPFHLVQLLAKKGYQIDTTCYNTALLHQLSVKHPDFVTSFNLCVSLGVANVFTHGLLALYSISTGKLSEALHIERDIIQREGYILEIMMNILKRYFFHRYIDEALRVRHLLLELLESFSVVSASSTSSSTERLVHRYRYLVEKTCWMYVSVYLKKDKCLARKLFDICRNSNGLPIYVSHVPHFLFALYHLDDSPNKNRFYSALQDMQPSLFFCHPVILPLFVSLFMSVEDVRERQHLYGAFSAKLSVDKVLHLHSESLQNEVDGSTSRSQQRCIYMPAFCSPELQAYLQGERASPPSLQEYLPITLDVFLKAESSRSKGIDNVSSETGSSPPQLVSSLRISPFLSTFDPLLSRLLHYLELHVDLLYAPSLFWQRLYGLLIGRPLSRTIIAAIYHHVKISPFLMHRLIPRASLSLFLVALVGAHDWPATLHLVSYCSERRWTLPAQFAPLRNSLPTLHVLLLPTATRPALLPDYTYTMDVLNALSQAYPDPESQSTLADLHMHLQRRHLGTLGELRMYMRSVPEDTAFLRSVVGRSLCERVFVPMPLVRLRTVLLESVKKSKESKGRELDRSKEEEYGY